MTRKQLDFDKSFNYQKHQRDYSLLGTTIIIRGLFNENKKFFGPSSPRPIFLVIKDGVFYHFMSEKDGINRCNALLKKNTLKQLQGIKKEYNKKLKDFNKFYKEDYENPEEAIKVLRNFFIDFTNIILMGFEVIEYCNNKINKNLYKLYLKIRKKYEDVHKRCFSAEKKILNKLENKYKLNKNTLSYLTIREFEKFLKTKKVPLNIEKRKKFFIVRYSKSGEMSFSDKKLWSRFEEKLKDDNLMGKSSYHGIVSGLVKIIRKVEDAKKVKKGDILVASMTDPRYLFAMKKAVAFITDEGGILCHAAIVAREMKKPCIIGTKIATKVLKDGDLVEVDADRGIVRIIKKSK